MPFHFYSNPWVLKAAGLTYGSDADLGALEAVKATYNVHDHTLPPSPATPTTSSDHQPLRPLAPNVLKPVVVSISSEEDEVTCPPPNPRLVQSQRRSGKASLS
ncbi:hypothetical protein LIER_18390 [Lithospermum erythrorhizon]|uniref:Uncharacterized protein n=1 Tax=Lithospermum erythrorhizon TaxID=34254 RepID=A0AAV3QDT9_LITER